ncbi:hypothetical protein Micbo1qcDRAFT_230958 [Microdochium bolleyi]|uniref:Uncharacterized protein n=1 Tax=Microdochium bolleyi TaxID=196109 RepID=A0A136JF40_9PEZI|nr:hypothetical protein Micbo1qcDRAFT_230958 [Microdochium bolleyi]
MENPPVEILVHIAAPSRAADDTRCRALASAYVNFEPARRAAVVQGPGEHIPPPASSPREDHNLPTNPPGTFASLQASFDSVIDNAGSPHVARPRHEILHSQPSTASSSATPSWQSPSSLVGDSQPEISSIVAGLNTPTRLLEHYLQGFDSFRSPSWTPSQRTSNSTSGSVLPSDASARNARPSLSGASAPSEPPQKQPLPSSPAAEDSHDSGLSFSVLKPVAEVTTKRQNTGSTIFSAQQTSTAISALRPASETALASSARSTPLSRSDSAPITVPQPSRHTTRALHQALTRATSDLGPRLPSSNIGNHSQVAFSPAHGFTLDSLELTAPEPPVASDTLQPSDLITQQLRDLLADAQPRRKTQTKEQRRNLRSTERGYWHVDCSLWTPELRGRTWAHLANWIGMGHAGWGTRCTRDEGFRTMRVYCWGETAMYLYYLLWLTSYRKILSTDCVWVDADGEAVIIMGMRS